MVEIEIRKYKQLDLKGGTVLDGFPSVGLVSTIAASYLINMLELDQIAALDSEFFPPLSMVYASKPKFPARIYASETHKFAAFVSEFTPASFLDRFLAKKLFSWAREQECSLIMTVVGLPMTHDGASSETVVLGVGSSEEARRRLDDAKIDQLDVGIVAGVPGTLLNEGRWADFDIIALLVRARRKVPDARAAAQILEVIGRLLPDIRVDVTPLYVEAERIEARLKTLRTQVKPIVPTPPKDMYR